MAETPGVALSTQEKLKKAKAEQKTLRNRRSRQKDTVSNRSARLNDANKRVKARREMRHDADSPAERERHADRLDALIGERSRIEANLGSTKTKLSRTREQLGRKDTRVAKLRRKIQNDTYQLSANFNYREMACNDGTPAPDANLAAARHLAVNYLEPLRAKFGPVSINSGYRHKAYNSRIGGASVSFHIYDLRPGAVATDIRCANGNPRDWHAFLDRLNPGGLGRYLTFIHIDNRTRAGGTRARWSG